MSLHALRTSLAEIHGLFWWVRYPGSHPRPNVNARRIQSPPRVIRVVLLLVASACGGSGGDSTGVGSNPEVAAVIVSGAPSSMTMVGEYEPRRDRHQRYWRGDLWSHRVVEIERTDRGERYVERNGEGVELGPSDDHGNRRHSRWNSHARHRRRGDDRHAGRRAHRRRRSRHAERARRRRAAADAHQSCAPSRIRSRIRASSPTPCSSSRRSARRCAAPHDSSSIRPRSLPASQWRASSSIRSRVITGCWLYGSTVDLNAKTVTGAIYGMGTYAIRSTPVQRIDISGRQPVGALFMTQSTQFTASLIGPQGETLPARTLTWTSSHPSKVTVDATGKVSAVGRGERDDHCVDRREVCGGDGDDSDASHGRLDRATDWTTYQGDSRHSGYVNATLDPVAFKRSGSTPSRRAAVQRARSSAAGAVRHDQLLLQRTDAVRARPGHRRATLGP